MSGQIIKLIGVFGLAATALANPAHAQDTDLAPSAASPKVMSEFGRCIVQNRRMSAQGFVATFPFTQSAAKSAKRLTTGGCLMAYEMVNSEGARGAIYEALYRADFRSSSVDPARAPQLDYGPRSEQPMGQPVEVLVNLRKFGDCVVRTDAKNARDLVLSDMGSAAESLAFVELAPAMNGCIVPGHSLTFKKPMLRAVIAETLYRLTSAAAGRPALADRR